MFLKIVAAILVLFTALSQFIFTPDVIRIDFDNTVDKIRPVHNIGRMPEYELDSSINSLFTDANMTLCRTHDITCTDIHNIFPDFSADVNEETSYHFEECDKVLAAIIDTGMTPFFRLGISYSDAQKDHELLLPPTDYAKWAQICEHIIRHYNEGWANGFTYGIEYWEIWNEPDGGEYEFISENEYHTQNVFWHGSAEEFYRLYDVSAKYLKDKFPELKIGGYGSCGFYAVHKYNIIKSNIPANMYFISFFEGFLNYIRENNTPMDFFSWHSYSNAENCTIQINYVKEKLEEAGFADAQIICDEWNCNPTENKDIDRRYGANQTSMLLVFQNEGVDVAHYYCGIATGALHGGMFYKGGKPTSAYYGFWAFGQLYKLGNQAQIKNMKLRDDLYAVAATGKDGQALLIANVSEDKDRTLKIDAGDYFVDQCFTVNDNGEWVAIELPDKIESGSILYITFKK